MGLTLLDHEEKPTDIVLGLENPEKYTKDESCLGAIIGRNANRISNASYSINERAYQLTTNEGHNNNHSGPQGFEHRLWHGEQITCDTVTFTLNSPDMDQGYPGDFHVSVQYSLEDGDSLSLKFSGICDRTTIANMTTHIYWNLDGEGNDTIGNHVLHIPAHRYLPIDPQFVPLPGGAKPVNGTPMDFTIGKQISQNMRIHGSSDEDMQLSIAQGYNHAFIYRQVSDSAVKPLHEQLVAEAVGQQTGIRMRMFSDAPTLLLYTAGFLNKIRGKNGHVYGPHSGLCLEPGFAPNSINDSSQISPILSAGQHYEMSVRYCFDIT